MKYPIFKENRGRQSITYVSTAFSWDADTHMLKLAKMEKSLDIRWSRSFRAIPTSVTISKDPAGRYFVSFLVEEAIAPLPACEASVDIDLGLTNLVVLSTGEKIANPKPLARSARRLKQAQQALCRQ